MRTRAYKTRPFTRWAHRTGLTDEALRNAVNEVAAGLIDADLGGHVIKKRIGLSGRGKRGGARTLIAFRQNDKAFFIYGFQKNERENITRRELIALRRLARELLELPADVLAKAIDAEEIIEVTEKGND